MSALVELLTKTPPLSSKFNKTGVDRTPIGTDDPNGEMKPSLDLSKDETRLKKARNGSLIDIKYTNTHNRD